MADVNINVGNISSINLRQQGSNPSAPANGISLFDKASGIYFVDSNNVISGPLGAMFAPGGRLSLQSGTAVTTTDMHSGTTLWYNSYVTDMLPLWDGSKIVPVQFAPTAIPLAGLSGTSSFDVFAYLNSGVPAYETSMWTSPTARAVNISMQNGRLSKVGDATRLYLGSFYTSSGGQTDNSLLKRNVWNYYNRLPLTGYIISSDSHTYNSTTYRYWNNNSSYYLEFVLGVVESPLIANLYYITNTAATNNVARTAMTFDGSTALDLDLPFSYSTTETILSTSHSTNKIPSCGIGWHIISIMESAVSGIGTFNAFRAEIVIMG